MRARPNPAAALAGAAVLLLCASCGPKSFSVNAVPFPAEKPVFLDEGGAAVQTLPAASEPVRIVFLDFPWCAPCTDAWNAVSRASASFPPGSVRLYRILFDRERIFAKEGASDVPPLRGAPPREAAGLPVTTLSAIPAAFREEFRVEQVPVLFIMDASGRVVRRWNGFSPALSSSLAAEVTRLSTSPLPPGR